MEALVAYIMYGTYTHTHMHISPSSMHQNIVQARHKYTFHLFMRPKSSHSRRHLVEAALRLFAQRQAEANEIILLLSTQGGGYSFTLYKCNNNKFCQHPLLSQSFFKLNLYCVLLSFIFRDSCWSYITYITMQHVYGSVYVFTVGVSLVERRACSVQSD